MLAPPILVACLLYAFYWHGPRYGGCEHDDEIKNEADGLRMVNALLAEWLEKGVLPARLKDLPKEALPDTLSYWNYGQPDRLAPRFELSIGNYDVCDWEMSIGFRVEWRVPLDSPVKAEALELLKIIIRRYLADGAWPASLEALGLPVGWGQQGAWHYEAPRRGPRLWDEMIPGYLFLPGSLGPELMLEFDPPDLYANY